MKNNKEVEKWRSHVGFGVFISLVIGILIGAILSKIIVLIFPIVDDSRGLLFVSIGASSFVYGKIYLKIMKNPSRNKFINYFSLWRNFEIYLKCD